MAPCRPLTWSFLVQDFADSHNMGLEECQQSLFHQVEKQVNTCMLTIRVCAWKRMGFQCKLTPNVCKFRRTNSSKCMARTFGNMFSAFFMNTAYYNTNSIFTFAPSSLSSLIKTIHVFQLQLVLFYCVENRVLCVFSSIVVSMDNFGTVFLIFQSYCFHAQSFVFLIW